MQMAEEGQLREVLAAVAREIKATEVAGQVRLGPLQVVLAAMVMEVTLLVQAVVAAAAVITVAAAVAATTVLAVAMLVQAVEVACLW
jgi:hypothetical protein